MSMVYVRWYGKVLEGELLDGEMSGMKQVRIPLDGHHPVALFTPQHVYARQEDVPGKFPVKIPDVSPNSPKISNVDVLPAIDREQIEAFKRDNWDHQHNHLRTDKLDEFYQLWRMLMVPFGYVETVPKCGTPVKAILPMAPPSEPPKRIVSDERMEELRKELKKAVKPQRKEPVQLSLF